MGGVVEGGVGIADKTSPRCAAIDKVQAELRQEHDFREKRKRELEFLENGGDPLEYFKDRNTLALSVQSTSFTGQHPDQYVSEAKGSFALTASPHGDSVESSGRLGTNTCEPNSADNLMLFECERTFSEGDKNSSQPRSDPVPSDKFSLVDGKHRTQERGDSAAFCVPRKAYKRRNRSRPNRDGTRSSSTNVNLTCGSHGSLPSLHVPMETKDLASDAENQNISSNCNNELTTPVDNTLQNITLTESKKDLDSAGKKTVESKEDLIEDVLVDTASGALTSEAPVDDKCKQKSASGDVQILTQTESDARVTIQGIEEMTSSVIKCQTSVSVVEVESLRSSCHMNGLSSKKEKDMKSDELNCSDLPVIKGLDSTSSCTKGGLICDGRITSEMLTEMTNADPDGKIRDQTAVPDGATVVEGDEFMQEKKETRVVDSSSPVNLESGNTCKSWGENVKILSEEAVSYSGPGLKNEVKNQVSGEKVEPIEPTGAESGRTSSETLADKRGLHNENENSLNVGLQDSTHIPITDVCDDVIVSPVAPGSSGSDSKLAKEVDDDAILKAAQLIEANRKRIMEFSIIPPKQSRLKLHWDYVIEEMAWLANDFAQEHAWKIAAAAQISSQASLKYRSRLQEKSSGMVAKKAAHNLAKSIVEFWQSAEETSKVVELKSQDEDRAHTLQAYAMRFLKYNNCIVTHSEAEVPPTPDRLIDIGISNLSWEDSLAEENLFYTVPAGAMVTYINSIEGYGSQCERIGSSIQEEIDEMSICDAIADFESQDIAYDEDEGETDTHYMLAAFEGSNSSRYVPKKRKHLAHAYCMQTCEVGSDTMGMQYPENKFLTQQSTLLAKRPGRSLNVSIPTKRVRTASRRVISPFNAGPSEFVQALTKADASSGDTNSFQDDQRTPYGGSLVPNNLEAESFGNFEKQYPYDSAEVSKKHKKKKKKAKHLQVDSTFQNDQANFQRDHLRKSYQLDSNGSNGLLTQSSMKKPKTMRQSLDNSFENITPVSGSVPSPVASQMSNMSNPNKFIKVFGGRERGRRPKILKLPAGQPGTGSPWTLFEDQALVVLAHDMGPNWELVSDALNSTMYFKSTCRNPKECKERHNFLMDRTSGDGADSAEDSGSSQPYPYTLPGIPKGSARQLFQRLQGPIEEETIKSHFEKIIIIEQKKHYRKSQDPKQLQQPHSSHAIALSQALQNNLDGGILTPLDLCDATVAGADIPSTAYQGQHSGGPANSNQATATQPHLASGASSVLQGPPNMIGNNFSMLGNHNTSVRGGRYVVPRSASLSPDEQQRMHRYNQMMSGRNTSQISSSGALQGTDRGVRLLPGGSGMGLVCVNRSLPTIRPGLQGISSSSIANCGNLVSSSMTSASMNSGVGSGQGSTMSRPRETLNVMQPGLNLDSPQQILVPDLQMQVSPRSNQGISHFGGLSSTFPNQSTPQGSSYTLHHQPLHPMSPHKPQPLTHDSHIPTPQQQSYAVHLAKERQQHRFLQQQQQQQQQQLQQPQFTTSGSMMSHVQSQPQQPVSSTIQGQLHPGPLSPMAPTTSLSSMAQHQEKHHTSSQGVVRSAQASGLSNQTSKQRQRQQQQFSQVNRQHPLQRQQQQAQLPSKVTKGVGRGNLMIDQNVSIGSVAENGVSTSSGNQSLEKEEAATQLTQSHGLHSGSTLNAVQPTKKYVSPQSPHQSLSKQKVHSGQTTSSMKHINQQTSQLDNNNQNHVPAVVPRLSAGHQSIPAMAVATGSNHHQVPLPSQQKSENGGNTLQRVNQPNHQINSASSIKPQARDSGTNKKSLSSSTEVDTMTSLCSVTNSAANVVQAPPAGPHQWEASEPSLDPRIPNSAVNCSSAPVSSNAGESTQSSQGIGLRQSSASLTSARHDGKAQWQQQPSKLQQPNSPVSQPQQHQQPVYTQHQAQLLQPGNDNLYGRAGENRL